MINLSLSLLPLIYFSTLKKEKLLSCVLVSFFVSIGIYCNITGSYVAEISLERLVNIDFVVGSYLVMGALAIRDLTRSEYKNTLPIIAMCLLSNVLMSTENLLLYFFSVEMLYLISYLLFLPSDKVSISDYIKSDILSAIFLTIALLVVLFSNGNLSISYLSSLEGEVSHFVRILIILHYMTKLGLLLPTTSVVNLTLGDKAYSFIPMQLFCIGPLCYKFMFILKSFLPLGIDEKITIFMLSMPTIIYIGLVYISSVKFVHGDNTRIKLKEILNMNFLVLLLLIPLALLNISERSIIYIIVSSSVSIISLILFQESFNIKGAKEDMVGLLYRRPLLALLMILILYNTLGMPLSINYKYLITVNDDFASGGVAFISLCIFFTAFFIKFRPVSQLYSELITSGVSGLPKSTRNLVSNEKKILALIALLLLSYVTFAVKY